MCVYIMFLHSSHTEIPLLPTMVTSIDFEMVLLLVVLQL